MRRISMTASMISLLALAVAVAVQSPVMAGSMPQAAAGEPGQVSQPVKVKPHSGEVDPVRTDSTRAMPDAAKSRPPNPCDPAQAKAGRHHPNQNNASGGCSN